MEQQILKELFVSFLAVEPERIERLPGAGSNRRYYRLIAGKPWTDTDSRKHHSLIGVVGTSAEENCSFIRLAELFTAKGLSVPKVYIYTPDFLFYLQEDLGSLSLFDVLKEGREHGGDYGSQEESLLHKVMRDLPRFQMEAASEEVYSQCYPQPYFDERTVRFDLNYFKYCYLRLAGAEFNEMQLEDDFDRLRADLLSVPEQGFMYRDFQARNVMLRDGVPYYIDFQGGRRGPIYYDVASFLWQASARYSDQLRSRLIDTYIESLSRYKSIDRQLFMQRLQLFVLFRTLQVLGAYGFRGLWERKQHFIDSIPPALSNLRQLLAEGVCDDYPHLKQIIPCLH